MGKIADALRGCSLPQQKQTQVLRLDREHEELEAEVNVLRAKLLHLEAQVNPLQRTIERLEQELQRYAAPKVTITKVQEDLLCWLIHQGDRPASQIAHEFKMSTEAATFHLESLLDLDFVTYAAAVNEEALWRLDQAGRAYLAKRGLLA